jgi:hypothetical protein
MKYLAFTDPFTAVALVHCCAAGTPIDGVPVVRPPHNPLRLALAPGRMPARCPVTSPP